MGGINLNKILKISVMIIIVIIVILMISLFILKNKNENNLNAIDIANEENIEIGATKKIGKVTSRDDFYIVEKCIQKYIEYLKEKDIEKIYSCLDKEFLEQENITKDNIIEEIQNWQIGDFTAEKMYVYDDTETISEYFVTGLMENNKYYIIVKVDYNYETFSVLPNYYIDEDYMENQNGIKIIKIKG